MPDPSVVPTSLTGADYVAPSAERPLAPTERIGDLFRLNAQTEYVLQRISERSYFFQRYFYGTTFYVGDDGVLLFDPLEGRSEKLLEAIRTVTDKPVRAVVYSHSHADHIIDAAPLLATLGKDVDVVASAATADKLRYLTSVVPEPTTVLGWPESEYTFEDLTVRLHGFERAAHADDHAVWLLTQERVLHAPDLINADQPPFWRLAGSENYVYLPQNLEAARALEWDWVNGAHGNLGTHADVDRTFEVLADYRRATEEAMAAHPFESYMGATTNAHTTFMVAWVDGVTRAAMEILRPTYGSYYGFEAGAPSNVQMILHSLLSYR